MSGKFYKRLLKYFVVFFQKNSQQPVVDVIVVLIALPSLTILALLLESSTRGNWLEKAQSRYTVLGLGFALAIVCLSLCIYVTTRLGGKMWSGAIPSDGSGPHYSYYVSKALQTVSRYGGYISRAASPQLSR